MTGSTRGIGRAIAEAFGREGAIVVLNSRDQAAADQSAAEIGGGAVGIGADLSTESGVHDSFATVRENFDHLEVLVNNAGMPMVRPSIDLTLDEWSRTVGLNLTAPSWLRRTRRGRCWPGRAEGSPSRSRPELLDHPARIRT